ncbi:Uncharacterised protein [Mycobacteroides abscessus subsp. massiliense]|nr:MULTISPECIES: hypothetical protein [Mycobacteroides]MBN7314762.1 hypothetical protein [Mycobacteroides abscessus subsp. abscessus]MBV0918033.1 hypothetical protein [Mycobacteroides chelonae]RIT59388.1 hypothetical protein D2E95_09360 [Mycobacteroides abscessus]RIU52501.1 hypothetical protein D2F02_05665 [Mycobacteroides abscessus]SHX53745.1 Uncharacterised protein [Mycobacteroides abscessus subsp. abscessus]
MRERALTPETARQAAAWCEGIGDFEAAAELCWAAGEAEKFCPEYEGEGEGGQPVEQADDIIARIDEVLSAPYAGFDAMSWSPMSEDEKQRILAGEQDETDEQPRLLPIGQIHAILADRVVEWREWWDRLSEADQNVTPWYVVCFTCNAVGEREVDCVCANPSEGTISR